jgi:hypothetical protein
LVARSLTSAIGRFGVSEWKFQGESVQ